MATPSKDANAFRTIGELSTELGVAQHILRYWETKFPQLKPMQRAGNRRYYRPADVELARRIHRLLSDEGYTVKGVQKLLREKGDSAAPSLVAAFEQPSPHQRETAAPVSNGVDVERIRAIRDRLADALSS